MADYGVNIAIKFSEAKLNKLTNKLKKASESANKINEAFKKVQQKGGASLDKVNGTLDKKLKKLKSINKELQHENKLLTKNASLQRQATKSGRGGGGRSGGGFGGGGRLSRAVLGSGGRLSQAVLGGGFPLLFGGSPFQAAAGTLGGAFGGFAGGIGLQVVAGQIENLVGRTAEIGQAFSELSFDLDTVASATGISGTETQNFLEKIETYGSKAQAAELATKLLASRVGQDGVNALTSFGKNAATLGNNLSTIFTQVLASVAKVAGPILESLAKAAGNQAAKQTFDKATGLTGVELAAQKFRAGSMRGQDIKNFAKNLRAAGFEGTLPTSRVQARRISDEIAIRTGKAQMAIPELEIEQIAQTVQTPKEISAIKTAQRLLELSQRRIKTFKLETNEIKKATSFQDKIAAAQLLGDERTVARLSKERELSKIKLQQDKAIARINKNLPETQQALERQAIEAKATAQAAEVRANFERDIASIVKNEQNEAYKKQAEILKKNFELQQNELKKAQALAKGLVDTVRDGFVDGIKAATDETRSLTDALANMLNRLSDQLLNIAANVAFYGNAQGTMSQKGGIVGALFGSVASLFSPYSSLMGLGGRYEGQSVTSFVSQGSPPPLPPLPAGKALGGAVGAGRPYMVGERGPELFVPGAQGNIVPNNAMGGANVTVNVDASGSSVQGNGPSANQLGKAIGAAVQAELIKQKRPGGLLTR